MTFTRRMICALTLLTLALLSSVTQAQSGALADYNQAIQINPRLGDVWFNRGTYWKTQGAGSGLSPTSPRPSGGSRI